MRQPVSLLLLSLLAALAACTRPSKQAAEETPPPLVARHLSRALAGIPFQPVHLTATVGQGIFYGSRYDFEDPNKLVVSDRVRASAAEEWEKTFLEYRAPFRIEDVASVGRGDFLAHGTTDEGEDVLERWRQRPAPIEIVKEADPVGDGDGRVFPVLGRRVLYRGRQLGAIRAVGVDPHGRYAMLVHGAPVTVSRMALPSGTPVGRIHDATEIPNLARVTGMYPRDHRTKGRVWVLETFGNDDPDDLQCPRTILFDSDDDGETDAWQTLDEAAWRAEGYTDDVWGEDFISHDRR